MHGDSVFLTLTYDDNHLPSGGTLVPRDVQLFMKRLRKVLAPRKIRYYFVGEYGDETQRPHYHAALFGVSKQDLQSVRSVWNKGHIMLGDLTLHSAQYIAGYVTKKMTSKDDPRNIYYTIDGQKIVRHPEFARMSTKPGIGAGAVEKIFKSMISPDGVIYGLEDGDVPKSLKIGGKNMPLGRYMRRKLREIFKLSDGRATPESLAKLRAEMSLLQEDFLNDSEGKTFKEYLTSLHDVKVRQIQTRNKIFSPKRSL